MSLKAKIHCIENFTMLENYLSLNNCILLCNDCLENSRSKAVRLKMIQFKLARNFFGQCIDY